MFPDITLVFLTALNGLFATLPSDNRSDQLTLLWIYGESLIDTRTQMVAAGRRCVSYAGLLIKVLKHEIILLIYAVQHNILNT
jgi:hypothetical protein